MRMGFVGGYTLDLYCDGRNHGWMSGKHPSFHGETFSECVRKARADGWMIDKKRQGKEVGYAICPECRAKQKVTR